MKGLIHKFKRWLIKKLGGYTEQGADNYKIDTRMYKLPIMPIKLRAEMYVGAHRMIAGITDDEAEEFVKRELASKLADKIIEDDLFMVSCTDDIVNCERIYRGELNLIHPHDAAMISCMEVF